MIKKSKNKKKKNMFSTPSKMFLVLVIIIFLALTRKLASLLCQINFLIVVGELIVYLYSTKHDTWFRHAVRYVCHQKKSIYFCLTIFLTIFSLRVVRTLIIWYLYLNENFVFFLCRVFWMLFFFFTSCVKMWFSPACHIVNEIFKRCFDKKIWFVVHIHLARFYSSSWKRFRTL